MINPDSPRLQPNPEDRPEKTKEVPLKDVLIAASFSPNRSIDLSIQSLDLGIFGEEANKVLQLSFDDPNHFEWFTRVYVSTHERKVLLDKKPFRALTHKPQSVSPSITFKTPFGALGSRSPINQDKYFATIIHSYPEATPTSSFDLGGILINSNYPEALTCAFSSSSVEKMLIFRGKNSPNFSRDQVDSLVQGWETEFQIQFVEKNSAEMSPLDKWLLERKLQWDLLIRLAQKYDLIIFRCANRDFKVNTAARISLSQPDLSTSLARDF